MSAGLVARALYIPALMYVSVTATCLSPLESLNMTKAKRRVSGSSARSYVNPPASLSSMANVMGWLAIKPLVILVPAKEEFAALASPVCTMAEYFRRLALRTSTPPKASVTSKRPGAGGVNVMVCRPVAATNVTLTLAYVRVNCAVFVVDRVRTRGDNLVESVTRLPYWSFMFAWKVACKFETHAGAGGKLSSVVWAAAGSVGATTAVSVKNRAPLPSNTCSVYVPATVYVYAAASDPMELRSDEKVLSSSCVLPVLSTRR
mmetsp:Transcript_27896/g.46731  ORF Transcript_27896/g.46731 Transcript_27896/m.46731 type:complete len:261 (+) Transcript_27896:5714-6496(+)